VTTTPPPDGITAGTTIARGLGSGSIAPGPLDPPAITCGSTSAYTAVPAPATPPSTKLHNDTFAHVSRLPQRSFNVAHSDAFVGSRHAFALPGLLSSTSRRSSALDP